MTSGAASLTVTAAPTTTTTSPSTTVPALLNAGGAIEVTCGGTLSAVAYGLPTAETGEIVLMSTSRLLQTFKVQVVDKPRRTIKR